MFDNTIALPLNGGTVTLTRVNQDKFASLYRYRGTEFDVDVTIRHTNRKDAIKGINIDRHNVEMLIVHKWTPTWSTVPVRQTFKVYYVFETEGLGDAAGDLDMAKNALRDGFMTSDFVRRLAVWES